MCFVIILSLLFNIFDNVFILSGTSLIDKCLGAKLGTNRIPCKRDSDSWWRSPLTQGARGWAQQGRDGHLCGQPARLPRQHPAQLQWWLLGQHGCGASQPWLLHAGLPVAEALDQKAHLQGRSSPFPAIVLYYCYTHAFVFFFFEDFFFYTC